MLRHRGPMIWASGFRGREGTTRPGTGDNPMRPTSRAFIESERQRGPVRDERIRVIRSEYQYRDYYCSEKPTIQDAFEISTRAATALVLVDGLSKSRRNVGSAGRRLTVRRGTKMWTFGFASRLQWLHAKTQRLRRIYALGVAPPHFVSIRAEVLDIIRLRQSESLRSLRLSAAPFSDLGQAPRRLCRLQLGRFNP
jgi:hypothetical protein